MSFDYPYDYIAYNSCQLFEPVQMQFIQSLIARLSMNYHGLEVVSGGVHCGKTTVRDCLSESLPGYNIFEVNIANQISNTTTNESLQMSITRKLLKDTTIPFDDYFSSKRKAVLIFDNFDCLKNCSTQLFKDFLTKLKKVCKSNWVVIFGVLVESEFSDRTSGMKFTRMPPFSTTQIGEYLKVDNETAKVVQNITYGWIVTLVSFCKKNYILEQT